MDSKQKSILQQDWFQTVLASLLCILCGLLLGFVALWCINPYGATDAMIAMLKNFFYFPRPDVELEYLGSTLAKTAPLLMCTLAILFAYKVGLFNIGASGQYTLGACAALYLGIKFALPWWLCLVSAVVAGAVLGAVIGMLKAELNVNEVISGIMLNWISLYSVNMILTGVKEASNTYTLALRTNSPKALLPGWGLPSLFANNQYVTIAIPLAILFALGVWLVLERTKLGYELKATGLAPQAAKYAGMQAHKNIVLTMAISGGLAGLGAAFLYLSGIEQWSCAQTAVPAMGFNGIAAAFLGGLHPLGSICAAFFIQHITSGGAYVDKMMYCSQISDFVVAIIIYASAFVLFIKLLMHKRLVAKTGKGVQ